MRGVLLGVVVKLLAGMASVCSCCRGLGLADRFNGSTFELAALICCMAVIMSLCTVLPEDCALVGDGVGRCVSDGGTFISCCCL